MHYTLSTLVLLAASVANALPMSRRQIRIDAAATAEAHKRDNGATRAFTAIPIKTASGKCLSIIDQSGDFRKNLQVVEEATCNGSPLQQWDIITRGIHNNVANAALVVSTSVSSCLNFDDRRAAGNQVITFSCGGRADGGGQVTDSQLFEFNGSTTSVPLAPLNGRGAVCFSIVNGKLDRSACTSSKPAANQIFILGGGAASAPAPVPPAAPSSSAAPTASASPNPPSAIPTGSVRLDLAATAEAQRRDAAATRAFSNVPIKDASGNCLTVNLNSGDFRQNLMKVISQPCTGAATQQWDFITKGVHNDVAGATLIVSSATNGCLNFDGRRQPGDRANLFSCGGRADGDGRVTDSQLFPFPDPTKTSLTLAPQNERGAVCLAVINGALDQASCNNAAVFTIGNAAAALPPPAATTASSSAAPAPTSAAPAPTVAPPATNNPSVGTVRLDAAATAEAHKRDNGATRALTAAPIKVGGKCLQANLNTGDFRQNLMEVAVVDCVAGLDVQQWDIIISGIHNNVAGQALVVSSRTNACLNFDDRRAAGNQVLLFSCGGRADGGGAVTNSQQFAFNGKTVNIPLVPNNVQNSKCVAVNGGKLDIAACNPASPNAAQTFTLGNGAAAPAPTSAAPTVSSPAATAAPTVAPPTNNNNPSVGTVRLDAAATAEAHKRDNGATRAFTAAPIKVGGKCLQANLNTGDFRQNLMEVAVVDCVAGLDVQQWDIITSGIHNNVAGQALVVSSRTNACLNFDDRRAAGNKVLLFSCGGRADGGGAVTNSQQFAFDGKTVNIPLVPNNVQKSQCITANGGKLDIAACNPANPNAAQTFTIA